MNEFKSVYFSLSFWHSLEKEKNIYTANIITESANATVSTTFSKKKKKSGVIKKCTQANYDEAIWIFNFLLFISPLNGFLFKGSCSSKSILFIYSYFLQRKILYNLFFSSQNNIWRNIIYTHYYSLYYDRLFPMPSSGDNSWSVCPRLGRTYSLDINQRVALTDL